MASPNACWLLENQEWDFAAVYYDGIDHFGHGFMEYNPPRMSHVSPQDFDIYRHVMQGAYRFHDMMLGRLLQIVGPDTVVLLVSDHGFFSNELRPPLSRDPKDPRRKIGPGANPVAWHRQFGVFGALGPGIREDELVHGASLLDIAPTVLALLGLPVPQDMDGKPLTQIFTQPPRLDSIETYEPPHPDDGVQREEQPDDPESSRVVLERLAELGYIEGPQADQSKVVERALADRRHNLAQVYFSSGQVTRALEILTELLKQGENPHLRCRIAMCHLSLDKPELAEQILEPVMAEPFDHPLADMLYAEVLLKRGEYEPARELLEKTQAANPRLGHLHTHLGLVYLHERDWSRAEQAFRRALEIDGDNAEAHDHLGVALQRQGRFKDAAYHHMRSAALVHHRAQTHLHLGMALGRLKRTDWAIRALNIAVELAPQLPLPHRLLARLYRRQKNESHANCGKPGSSTTPSAAPVEPALTVRWKSSAGRHGRSATCYNA
jgi:tetratricopeptide (TPR) repeat protein